MADYDIEEAFEAIEKELIESMMRNLERHKAEEDDEGFNWSMWQAEQLKSLQEFKKRNKDKFGKEFEYINKRIEMFIKGSRRDGQLEQERKILKALKEGKARAKGEPGDVSGNFFRINDRKLNALIKATTNDFEKAETAMLRRADDQYRKIIYNAQVYANTGAGTYEKAVDMATKDFLSRGIDCIEYKNGSRHNIRDYARMCLRTAGKRAYLTGEGESRQERGLHLVIINKRGNPCPLCAKWLGKVLIDDVWSGGSKKDGDYPLMSQAIAEKLFHPMCEDVCDTYFDDGFDDWYDSASKEERKEMLDRYNNGQKMNYAKRQAEKYGRLEEYSLDEGNKRVYGIRKGEWEQKREYYGALMEDVDSDNLQNYRPLEKSESLTENKRGIKNLLLKKILNSVYKGGIYISESVKIKPKNLHFIEKSINEALSLVGEKGELPICMIINSDEMQTGAICSYNAKNNILYIDSIIGDKTKLLELQKNMACPNNPLSTFVHEMIHWKDAEKFRKSKEKFSQNEYIAFTRKKSKKKLDRLEKRGYNVFVSEYAENSYYAEKYDETLTEFWVEQLLGKDE